MLNRSAMLVPAETSLASSEEVSSPPSGLPVEKSPAALVPSF